MAKTTDRLTIDGEDYLLQDALAQTGKYTYDRFIQGSRDDKGEWHYYTDRVTTEELFNLKPGDRIGFSGVKSGQLFGIWATDGTARFFSTGWLSNDIEITVTTAGQYYIAGSPSSGSVIRPEDVELVVTIYDGAALPNSNEERIAALETPRLEPLYISAFRQGGNNESGYVTNAYRISSAETVGLPMGRSRELRGTISTQYVLGIRTGATAQNLNHALYWYTGSFAVSIPAEDNYYRLYIARNTGTSSHEQDAITPMTAEQMGLALWWTKTADVLRENAEAEKIISSARLRFYPDSVYTPNTLNDFAVIAHTSDVHGDYQRTKNFYDFADKIGADAACVTGDMVSFYASDGLDWFKSLTNAAATLPAVCVGNHETQGNDSLTDDDIYSLVFSGIENKVGNTTGESWYYKDIPSKKLRIISVNLYQYGSQIGANPGWRFHTHLLSDQVSWLVSALQTTPSDYGILLLSHAPQVPMRQLEHTGYDAFFQSGHMETGGTHSDVTGTPIYDLIDAFIARTSISQTYAQMGTPDTISVIADFSGVDASVEFIAHLSGHFHSDGIGYVPNTARKQLQLCVTSGSALYGGTANPYLTDQGDQGRNKDDATQDAFNIYVIDRPNKSIKVIRVGSNMTYDLRERKYMIIPYAD